MKKKLTALLAGLFVAFSLVGCGFIPSNASSQESSQASTSTESTVSNASTQSEAASSSSQEASTESSVDSSAAQYDYTAFTATEKALFVEFLGETIPFIANNEYYVQEYSYTYKQIIETGINFYTVGNTEEEFDGYRELLEELYRFYEMRVEENGYIWYSYQASNYFLRVAYYEGEKGYTVDVYAYTVADWDPIPPQSSIESSIESSAESSIESSINSSEKDSSIDSSVEDVVDGDVGEILLTLYGLKDGESVTGEFTLTGKIIALDGYDNPTIEVEGFENMPVYCYRLQLPEASVGDIITVTATTLKNYQGTYEFMNCTLVESQGGGLGGGSTGEYTHTEFTADEKALFNEYFGEVIPFLANDEYYVEEYTLDYAEDGLTEVGINFYTYGNTKAEFNTYKAMFDNKYESAGSEADDYGDMWYFYDAPEYCIDLSYYQTDDGYVVDVYVYFYTEYTGGGEGGEGEGGGNTTDVDLITNEGKGLPTGENGVYNVDFTKATYVKNVTEQGTYEYGCPTEGAPSVLVIPVEFSDVTAASKGYTIDAIKAAFNGGAGETDYYSVHDYYYISSYGKLDLNFTVLDTWFKPEHDSAYYTNATIDYFGSTIEGGDQLIMDEALAFLSESMDLAKFDTDGNTCIDAIVMINTLDINSDVTFQWAYRYWNVYTDADGYYYEYDGVSANDYLWASYQFLLETYDEVGNPFYEDTVRNTYTYIHEFGHVLGADDYYDTSYVNEEGPLAGCDIMDSMLGDHNAYTKFNFGWLTNSRLVVAEESVTLTLEDFSKNGDTIIIANNWDEALGVYQEYYIVAYYTNNGLNADGNGYFSRDGIVVYHVNASLYGQDYGDGTIYYDVYNNNTDVSDSYGTADNLIEYVKSPADTFTYVVGDSLSASLKDDNGNQIAYTFTVDALTAESATLTFTKN